MQRGQARGLPRWARGATGGGLGGHDQGVGAETGKTTRERAELLINPPATRFRPQVSAVIKG
jgi:hypothetical protein